jgi:hypothetical protein
MLAPMNETISPTLLLGGALFLGIGLYLIQRGRFVIPVLLGRSAYFRQRPRAARYLFYFILTFGILAAGTGCRILLTWLRGV